MRNPDLISDEDLRVSIARCLPRIGSANVRPDQVGADLTSKVRTRLRYFFEQPTFRAQHTDDSDEPVVEALRQHFTQIALDDDLGNQRK